MNYHIDEKDFRSLLLQSSNPGRYAGGEFGCLSRKPLSDKTLKIAVSYPDLYEIGMCNNAVKILYNRLNKIDNLICDRVFAPALDFEEQLRNSTIPLFTLENRIPLGNLDILAFSFGYELTATNILNMLELSDIPLYCRDRSESDPVVIAGGPGATNPVPFGFFLDAVFIGEAEGVLDSLMIKAAEMKKNGAGRNELLKLFSENDYIWTENKKSTVRKAIYSGFGEDSYTLTHLPVPSVKTVQDHGVVEIMRGCPNGCRFCHAGYLYRPKREKTFDKITEEIDDLVYRCGYREITLSSLSSGDYSGILPLFEYLNKKYSADSVSFALPSLKVDSFTLPLLAGISETRKSGLTFAVETPDPLWQKSINKEVNLEQVLSIITEAKQAGWRSAKLYFMIGLPPAPDADEETDNILDFVNRVYSRTGMNINLNIGTFIPKPHTPYQRAAQLREEKALEQIYKIKKGVKGKNIKFGYHSPFMSYIEGIFSRGDEKAGALLLAAFKKGAKLDAWEEHFNRELWKEAIAEQDWNVEYETCRERSPEEKLPWDNISLGISGSYLKKENEKSLTHDLTGICSDPCSYKCGICDNNNSITSADTSAASAAAPEAEEKPEELQKEKYRVIFSFEKNGSQIYAGHLDVMRVFERAFLRSRLPVIFTEGFNPKPRLEFAHPLSLGIASDDEIAAIDFGKLLTEDDFKAAMNKNLPEGYKVKRAVFQKKITGEKIISLMSVYYGSQYTLAAGNIRELFETLKSFITREKMEKSVELELRDSCIYITIKKGENSKSLLKILKESTGRESPLSDIEVLRLKTFASEKMLDYLLFFS